MVDPATVTKTVAPDDLSLPDTGDIVLYPYDVDGEVGQYPRSAAVIVDELTGGGLDVRTWHDQEQAHWFADRDLVVLPLILGVLSAAAWDGIKKWLGKRKSDPVDLTVGYRKDGSARWVNITGPANAVAETLDKVKPGSDHG